MPDLSDDERQKLLDGLNNFGQMADTPGRVEAIDRLVRHDELPVVDTSQYHTDNPGTVYIVDADVSLGDVSLQMEYIKKAITCHCSECGFDWSTWERTWNDVRDTYTRQECMLCGNVIIDRNDMQDVRLDVFGKGVEAIVTRKDSIAIDYYCE